jgi:putative ABC transport system ATP-binding protein
MQPIVSLKKVVKQFDSGDVRLTVLDGIDLTVQAGEFIAIVGPSGNGKSTLLNMVTGIDHPTSGEIVVNQQRLHRMSEDQLSAWRGRDVGIVFQFFQLLPALTLLQNTILPMDFVDKSHRNGRLDKRARRRRAELLLELVGLSDQMHKLPGQVSGGQQQRAAIARALANDPPLIVADEPTGNLDGKTSDEVFNLFKNLTQVGKTVLMVTHNDQLACQASRTIEIRNGRIVRDENCNPGQAVQA